MLDCSYMHVHNTHRLCTIRDKDASQHGPKDYAESDSLEA